MSVEENDPFSQRVRDELVRLWPEDSLARRAELAGLVRTRGTLHLVGRGQVSLSLTTEHPGVARRILSLLKDVSGVHALVRVYQNRRLRRRPIYDLSLERGGEAVLEALGILVRGNRLRVGLKEEFRRKAAARRAYLRGVFLGAGSVANPEKGHHLEMVFGDEGQALVAKSLLAGFGLRPGLSRRQQRYLLYLKGSEDIVSFLNLVGAHQALLSYENTRALKSVKNQVNRQVNADTANLARTVEAAQRQIGDIRLLAETLGLEALPPGLRQLAEARLADPEASLTELGRLLDPPLGKSGVNHRLRKLSQLAAEVRAEVLD
ncbi:MAG: DNA-binding protein WhiA [Firmicutes bacterium]|nr:DNA-binding protein WhiA [Bacillota bacterium]MCL5039955.1 DNA-binding protein WhiA [Bacillota bacterium]